MCGIAGFTQYHHQLQEPRSVIKKMTDSLAPRGPDGEGMYLDSGVVLGHRRLSIIDISGGSQPMTLADGRFTLVFNGEIYNYLELRAELESVGCCFLTHSDTEVLLHQFAKDGVASLDRLNGMFAFALWDKKEERLFLARDRLGKKPLYYMFLRNELVFSSELKALVTYPGFERTIELRSLNKFLAFGYIPAPHTIWKGVFKLEPGTWLQFDRNGLQKNVYWDIPLEDNPLNTQNVDECAQQLMVLLKDSVKKRLRSDVPVGVFLSGGIDSSTVTALAAQEAGNRLHSFSIGFEDPSYDESSYALKVAQLFGTHHHHEVLSIDKTRELIPEVFRMLDEPFADASILPTYWLSKFTSGHVKVVLGGDGSDELFAGYPSFQAHWMMDKLSFLPTTWRDALNRLARRLPVSYRYASWDHLLQQFFKGAGISPEIRFMLWMGCCGNEQRNQLLTEEVQQSLLRENPYEDVINYVRQSRLFSDFQRITYLCSKLYLQDGVLVKVDRASMANGLEVRAPFLDYQFVEFACSIRPQYKLKGLTTKYILKRAVAGLLPADIIHRRKAGFMMPVAKWLEKDLVGMLEDLCSESRIRGGGYFNVSVVQRMIQEHKMHVRDHRKALWALLCFQQWARAYR